MHHTHSRYLHVRVNKGEIRHKAQKPAGTRPFLTVAKLLGDLESRASVEKTFYQSSSDTLWTTKYLWTIIP